MYLVLKNDHIVLVHGKQEIEFGQFKPKRPSARAQGKKFDMDKFVARLSESMFTEINGYWKTLPNVDQDKLFVIYQEVHEDILEAPTQSERHAWTSEAIAKIVDIYHPFEVVSEYMRDIEVRPTHNVKEDFDTNIHDSISRATTYVLWEYRDLATLTVILRAIAPIWNLSGRLSSTTSVKAGKVYHEIEMFNMLANTDFIGCKAFVRLNEFITATWDKFENGRNKQEAKNSILSSVVAGLGSSDIPTYLLATAVVNKLSVREINTFRDEGDLITHVYQRVETEVRKLADKFARLKAKAGPKDNDGEDTTGYLGTFRTRERVRRDVFILSQHYLMDYRKAKKALDDDIPVSLVKDCIESLQRHMPNTIRYEHRTLCQWVLSDIVNPRTIPHIDRPAMIHAMALTQAALIHWRFRNVATLISSKPAPLDDNSILTTTPFDAVSVDTRNRLAELFPYYRFSKTTVSRRQLCPGLQAVESYTKLFADQEWELSCSKSISSELRQEPGVFKPSPLLKSELAELLIVLNK